MASNAFWTAKKTAVFHASTISELSWMILQFSGIQNRHGCSLPLSIWHNSDIGFEWFWSPTQSYLEVSKMKDPQSSKSDHSSILKLEKPLVTCGSQEPPQIFHHVPQPWPPLAFLPPFARWKRWASAQVTPLQASAAQGTGHVAWQRGQGPFGRMFVHGLWPMVLLRFKGGMTIVCWC